MKCIAMHIFYVRFCILESITNFLSKNAIFYFAFSLLHWNNFYVLLLTMSLEQYLVHGSPVIQD